MDEKKKFGRVIGIASSLLSGSDVPDGLAGRGKVFITSRFNLLIKLAITLGSLPLWIFACNSPFIPSTPNIQTPVNAVEYQPTPINIGGLVTEQDPVDIYTTSNILTLIDQNPAETVEFISIAELFINQNPVFAGKSIEEAGLNALLVRDETSGQTTIYYVGYDQSSGVEWLLGYSWTGGVEQTNTPLYRTATQSVYYTDDEGNAVELVQHQPDGTRLVRTYSGTYTEAPADVPDGKMVGNAAPIPPEFITATSIQYMDEAYVALDATNNIVAIFDAESHEWHQAVSIAAIIGGGEANRAVMEAIPPMTTNAPENPNYPLPRDESGNIVPGFISCESNGDCIAVGRVAGASIDVDRPYRLNIYIDVPSNADPTKIIRISANAGIYPEGFRTEEVYNNSIETLAIGDIHQSLQRFQSLGFLPWQQYNDFGQAFHSLSSDQQITVRQLRPLWDLFLSGALTGMPIAIRINASQVSYDATTSADQTLSHLNDALGGIPNSEFNMINDSIIFLPPDLIDLILTGTQ